MCVLVCACAAQLHRALLRSPHGQHHFAQSLRKHALNGSDDGGISDSRSDSRNNSRSDRGISGRELATAWSDLGTGTTTGTNTVLELDTDLMLDSHAFEAAVGHGLSNGGAGDGGTDGDRSTRPIGLSREQCQVNHQLAATASV